MFSIRGNILRCLQAVPQATSEVLTLQKPLSGNLTRPGVNNLALPPDQPQPLHYDILGVKMGAPLRVVKLKYLLACRKYHPECGGDPEMFLRASLAYQDVLKDYGIESVEGEVLNLGNFQSDTYVAQRYLEARGAIKETLSMSTLNDHIAKLEEVQSKISFDLEQRITANDTDAMWLLEDIDAITEKGSDTFTLQLSESGTVTAHQDQNLLLASAQTPLIEGSGVSGTKGTEGDCRSGKTDRQELFEGSPQKKGPEAQGKEVVETVTLSKADVITLNAKHTVQQRNDVAGLAARTATSVMNNTKEVGLIQQTASFLFIAICSIGVLVYVILEAFSRASMVSVTSPQNLSQVSGDSTLPWWGNDSAYEKQVKRLFVDEWRKARSNARKTQLFQEGLTRENLSVKEKEALDLSIFSVTVDRLKKLKMNADSLPGKL